MIHQSLRTLALISCMLIVGCASKGSLDVARPQCEYLADPLGIDVPQPRLSWELQSNDRGVSQSAYQILVATSRKLLDDNQADLWASGRVESDQTMQIPYAGRPLASGQRAWWKVRVWDQVGQPSTFSDPACFEMGLLKPSDWKAQWIEAPRTAPTARATARRSKDIGEAEAAPLFRKTFTLDKPIASARAYICGLGYHELSLNGNKVGNHVLDPAFSQYNKRIFYVTHDITDQLKKGDNAVGVILGNAMYNQWAPDVWNYEKAPWRARPKLLMQIHVTYKDGSTKTIITDKTWKTSTGPILAETTRTGEIYDARLEKKSWATPKFDDSSWQPVIPAQAPTATLRAQMIPPMKVMRTFTPASVNQAKPGVFVYDMGQNMAGWARFSAEAPAGTTITLRFAERLNKDGTVDMSNIDSFLDPKLFQTNTYCFKGDGKETWEPRFVYHGFQYVEITGFPGKLDLGNLEARVIHTAFDQTGRFECSNSIINKLQQMTLWAYIGNFHSIPTDCPQREKNGWTGDAHLAVEQAMYNFDNAAGYTKWINDCADAQGPWGNIEAGSIPDIIPNPGWHMNGGPSWESVYIIIPWTMYQYLGDTRILEQHYDGMKRLLDRLGNKATNHIITWGLGDWVELEKTPTEVIVTSYYWWDAMTMARIARILGKIDDAKRFDALADQIKQAYQTQLYDRATATVKGGTQTAQATILYQGLCPPADDARVTENLLKALEAKESHLHTGVFGQHFMPKVLTDRGYADLVFKMMVQPSGPGWGEWVAKGYTTLQENWGQGSSQNHIFFGNISTWYYQSLAGIQIDPEQPAFKHIIIRPVPCGDLTYVNAHTRTIRGLVESNWKRSDKRFELTVTIPPNCTATVYLPATDSSKVTESGKPVKAGAMKDGRLPVQIGSGQYRFAVEH